ncbi:MAG: hypothetical protein ACOY42_01645 [Pseudomonadota bacterium]
MKSDSLSRIGGVQQTSPVTGARRERRGAGSRDPEPPGAAPLPDAPVRPDALERDQGDEGHLHEFA